MNPLKPNLTDILQEQALDPSITVKQIQQDLRMDGVDIDHILKKTRELVGGYVRQHYAELAQNQQASGRLAAAFAHFSATPIDEIKHWLHDIARGAAGPEARIVAQPCFRNKSAEDMSEAELRSLAAEIKATIESHEDGKSG